MTTRVMSYHPKLTVHYRDVWIPRGKRHQHSKRHTEVRLGFRFICLLCVHLFQVFYIFIIILNLSNFSFISLLYFYLLFDNLVICSIFYRNGRPGDSVSNLETF